ncbi:hypothetical protein C0J50_20677 [Silurus asotus]|uniref:Uncharacterized protein n=1 Tax=Silurus asotus TaxID=30991 RepID=A0AAD5APP7_SILAS|nr:hypothetical protein C0J50_20677 [Silurus asotus]
MDRKLLTLGNTPNTPDVLERSRPMLDTCPYGDNCENVCRYLQRDWQKESNSCIQASLKKEDRV